MTDESGVIEAINACKALFLTYIEELGFNSLRLVVAEGRAVGPPETIEVGGVKIDNATRIEPTDDSGVYELIWDNYVAYGVLNESFALADETETYEGRRFRLYSKSNFLNYVSKATFASEDYPGPAQHYCVACEDHIVDVLSVDPSRTSKLRA